MALKHPAGAAMDLMDLMDNGRVPHRAMDGVDDGRYLREPLPQSILSILSIRSITAPAVRFLATDEADNMAYMIYTFTSCFPIFSPLKKPRKAFGAFSNLSVMVSWYLTLLSLAYHFRLIISPYYFAIEDGTHKKNVDIKIFTPV